VALDSPGFTVLQKILYIGIGGGLGANARYWVGWWLIKRWGDVFPYATLFVNVTGSFLLGLFVVLISERYIVTDPNLRLLIAVGFLGSYTTFSTFEYQTFALASSGRYLQAALNFGFSLVAGFVAVWLGVRLARFL
jgi:fluoride exporter